MYPDLSWFHLTYLEYGHLLLLSKLSWVLCCSQWGIEVCVRRAAWRWNLQRHYNFCKVDCSASESLTVTSWETLAWSTQKAHSRLLTHYVSHPASPPIMTPTNPPHPRAAQTRAKCNPGSPLEKNVQIGVEADTGRMLWGWSGPWATEPVCSLRFWGCKHQRSHFITLRSYWVEIIILNIYKLRQ